MGEDSFEYRAFDGTNFSPLATVTINVENTNNDAPTDISLDNTQIAENATNGTAIAILATIDPDPGDTHTYSLLQDANGRFSLNGNVLEVADETQLTPGNYEITIETEDAGGQTYQEIVTIAVNEVNNPPTAINLSNDNVDENIANNTVVGTLTTDDADFGDTHTYQLLNNAAGRFGLLGNQLIVTDSNRIDYETATSHTITIRSIDNQGAKRDQDFIITLNNIVESGVITFDKASYTVNENDGNATLLIGRLNGTEGAISANVTLTDGSVIETNDYTNNSPIIVNFADGQEISTIDIPIVDDNIFEPSEDLNLSLSGAEIGNIVNANLTIFDNDAKPGIFNFTQGNYSVNEDGTPVIAITIERSEGTNGDVTVNVSLSEGSAIAGSDYINNIITVDFLDGESSQTFNLDIIDDSLLEVDETLNLQLFNPIGGATLGTQKTAVATIIDNDFTPTLTLEIEANSVTEGDNTISATLTRNTNTDNSLDVNLTSSDTSEITTPATVTIPVGETSVTFDLTIVDDDIIDLTQNATIIATSAGFISSSDQISVLNNDTVNLTLEFPPFEGYGVHRSPDQFQDNEFSPPRPPSLGGIRFQSPSGLVDLGGISENGGIATATITRDVVNNRSLVVQIESSEEVNIPTTVTIAADQASATFEVVAIDNATLDGTQTVSIIATPLYEETDIAIADKAVTTTIDIIDDESPSLSVSIDRTLIAETATATATITRNTDTTDSLTVNLTSSDTTEATVANTVTIAAGETSVTAIITGVSDGVSDGSQPVTISASATGLNSGSANLEVSDLTLSG